MRTQRSRPAIRFVAMILALGIVLIGMPRLSAAAAEAQGTGGGSVNSSLVGGERMIHFAFSAHTAGSADVGSFRFTIEAPNPEVDVHVDVDCLNVFPLSVGAGAWIAGVVDRVTPESNAYLINPGDRLAFYVTDQDQQPNAPGDQLQAVREFSSCKVLGSFFGFSISQGNINLKLP